ncbi:hypothetical protein [Flavobacterium sp.]|uniref:hypothetical protein n=1 Tax=Flavobacterium sp. TaxID=239 RepID=UPI0028BEE721|nr:hypothetical protein [Flavobacterium sp.]
MRQLLFLFTILSSIYGYSQKKYEFDYIIEYKLTVYKDSSTKKDITRYYFTNSKKNNYLAEIANLDSLNYQMVFKDENGISFNVNFLKADLAKTETITVDCPYVNRYQNQFKFRTQEYDFFNMTDTIIDGTKYSRYKLASIKPKKEKRKKLGTEVYIIDQKTAFHLPVFQFSTAYEEWKSTKNIPNGIFKERLLYDFNGNLSMKEEIVGFYSINKTILIDKGCDYTQEE